MYFRVLPVGSRPSANARNCAYLLEDDWDDWFKFSTLYTLVFFDENGELQQNLLIKSFFPI